MMKVIYSQVVTQDCLFTYRTAQPNGITDRQKLWTAQPNVTTNRQKFCMNTHEVHDLSSREIKPDKINPSPIPGGSGNVGKQSKASKRKENARLKTKQKARMRGERMMDGERKREEGAHFLTFLCCTHPGFFTYLLLQPVRLLVNDHKFPAGNSVFLLHQTSQQ